MWNRLKYIKEKFNTLKPDAKVNAIGDLKKGGDVELEEMANIASIVKIQDANKFALAKEYGYMVQSLIVENRHNGESEHSVPQETLKSPPIIVESFVIAFTSFSH